MIAPTELDELLALANAAALAGEREAEPRTRQALADELGGPGVDLARDLRRWRDDDGGLRAYARVRIGRADHAAEVRLRYAIARAADLALEGELLAWAAARAADEPAPCRLTHAVAIHDPGRLDRLAGHGFARFRIRRHLARSTVTPVPDAPLPPGYQARACRGASDAAAYCDALNDAFADAHDQTLLTVEDFVHDLASPDYRADRDLIVEGPDRAIAGFCFSQVDAERPTRGLIASVGVRAAHRRQGLAAAMVAIAIAGLRADGVTEVELEVDDDSLTGAGRVYQRMGFELRYLETRVARVISPA